MYLNLEEHDLKQRLAYETAREISQQPSTWRKTWTIVQTQAHALHEFLKPLGEGFDLILMGAGTSEYIGNVLTPYYNARFGFRMRSIPSTDMIQNPALYIDPKRPTLCISYGRSGNSPESVGSVQAADAIHPSVRHLFITCNKDGALAKMAKQSDRVFALLLPDETNDLGFAMTSSFTNMLLATILVFNLTDIEASKAKVEALASSVEQEITGFAPQLLELIKGFDFHRIIYLGSGLLKGLAQESALKVLELTAGKTATLFDTPTGFRHGPKSFIDPQTLIIVYLSDDPLTRRYELDLIHELHVQKKGYKVITVVHKDADVEADLKFNLPYDGLTMDYVALKDIVIAHMISFYKSYTAGNPVDNPCPTGEVNRVVTGVTIHPVKEN